jgi:hypothetical protein
LTPIDSLSELEWSDDWFEAESWWGIRGRRIGRWEEEAER